MKRATLAIAMGLLASIAHAEPDATAYQLQERCGKFALQVFQKEYDGGKPTKVGDDTMTSNYQAHYNPRLNKCFYLEMTTSEDGKSMTRILRLFDILENKEYGFFTSRTPNGFTHCRVQDKPCHSEEEWYQLTKQYLEE